MIQPSQSHSPRTQRVRTAALLAVLAVGAALLHGCGQVGPLYQPPPETAEDDGSGR